MIVLYSFFYLVESITADWYDRNDFLNKEIDKYTVQQLFWISLFGRVNQHLNHYQKNKCTQTTQFFDILECHTICIPCMSDGMPNSNSIINHYSPISLAYKPVIVTISYEWRWRKKSDQSIISFILFIIYQFSHYCFSIHFTSTLHFNTTYYIVTKDSEMN